MRHRDYRNWKIQSVGLRREIEMDQVNAAFFYGAAEEGRNDIEIALFSGSPVERRVRPQKVSDAPRLDPLLLVRRRAETVEYYVDAGHAERRTEIHRVAPHPADGVHCHEYPARIK
jgi:hypothetical protein